MLHDLFLRVFTSRNMSFIVIRGLVMRLGKSPSRYCIGSHRACGCCDSSLVPIVVKKLLKAFEISFALVRILSSYIILLTFCFVLDGFVRLLIVFHNFAVLFLKFANMLR